MTAQRANGPDEGREAEEERRALARLLGGSTRPEPALPPRRRPPAPEELPAQRSRPPTEEPTPRAAPSAAPQSAPRTPASAAPALQPARARFELRAARAPGLFGARFLALDHLRGEQEVWVERLEGAPTTGPEFEARFQALASELAGAHAILAWVGTELDARGRRLVAQPAREGESLRELLARRGTLPPGHAFEILRQVLLALEPLHARGLAHGCLQAEHVRLAARVPWSSENPFGVEVELAACGLAGLLGPAPTPRDDVRQAERLLAELLTGLPALDELAGRLPRAAERRLARLGHFEGAREFAAALAPPAAPTLAALQPRPWWFALTLGVALSCALFAWSTRRTLAAERAEAARRTASESSARADARARSALERVLELLEEGEAAEAARVLDAARDDAALAARGYGAGFLEAALEARSVLDAFPDEDVLARLEGVLLARDALHDARRGREVFLLAGAEWLAAPGATRAAPRAELLRWIEGLERELARRVASLERELARLAPELAARAHEPRVALVLARFAPALVPELASAARSEELATVLALAQDEAALLGRVGEHFLWRLERPDGAVLWREDRVLERHESGARMARRWLTPEAPPPREVHLAWRGTRLVLEPPLEAALDLAAPSRTSHFVPRPLEPAPPELSAAAAGALRATLAAASPRECASGEGRAWLVPGLGLVRRLLPDGSVLELAWRGEPGPAGLER